MADIGTSTNINFTKAEAAINELNTAVDQFSSSIKKAADDPTLKDLQAAGLESGFIQSYDQKFQDLIDAIKSAATSLKGVIEEFYKADDPEPTPSPTDNGRIPRGGGGGGGGGTGGGGGGGGGGGSDSPTPTPTKTATPTGEEDHDKAYKNLMSEFKNMSMEGLDGLAAELVKYAAELGISVDELLSNKKYSEKLHSKLLSNPNLSKDLKDMIMNTSSTVTQEVLKDIFTGVEPSIVGLNDDTASIYLSYLQAIANANGIDVISLVTDEKYNKLLKQSLSDFGKLSGMFNNMSDEEIVKRALEIYDGKNIENVDENSLMILRTYMDTEAADRGKDVQELDKSDADIFKNISRFGSLSTVLAASSASAIQTAMVNITETKKGTSSGSRGMDIPNSSSSESVQSDTIDGMDAHIYNELHSSDREDEDNNTNTNTNDNTNDNNTGNGTETEHTEESLPDYRNFQPEETNDADTEINAMLQDYYDENGNLENTEYYDVYNADGTIDNTATVDFNNSNAVTETPSVEAEPNKTPDMTDEEFEEVLDELAGE